ncbi:unnamed protein product [Heligmosomoides polygyrus]|uniref:CCHC-type domain-containing protein n=1 Tax=Heligmosomoides polygyrus TaxID=6339 RepID=A0A183F6L5_HELPZ|nr:unnamed protein product [Heligmosomoides polygyrus]
MGPITRSQAASSDNGDSSAASVTTPVNLPEIVTAPSAHVLTDIADDATIHGRDARQLRDATSEAIYQSTSHLAQHVNRGNAALAEGFNESFTVDQARTRTGYDRTNRQDPIQCFNCGGTGHYSRVCPSPRRESRSTGNNVLAALPPWTIDYGERVLMVKDEAINILSVFPDPVANEKPIAVRVAESTTLKPGTETFVLCYTSRLVETPVMLVAQSSQLQNKSIMVAPAILRSSTMKLLVGNPTQLLYKDQRISDAVPIAEEAYGTLSENAPGF